MLIENQHKAGWKKDFQSKLTCLIPILFFPFLAIFASTISTPLVRKPGPEFGVAAEKIIPRSSASSRGSQSLATSLAERIGCSTIEEVFLALKTALEQPHILKALEERCQSYDICLMAVKFVQSDAYRLWTEEPLITSPSKQLYLMSGSLLEKTQRDVQFCGKDYSDALDSEMNLTYLGDRLNEKEKQNQIPLDLKAKLENIKEVLDVNSQFPFWSSAAASELEAAIGLRDFLSSEQTVRPDRRDPSRGQMLRARLINAGKKRAQDKRMIQNLEVEAYRLNEEVDKRLEVNHQRSTSSDSTSPRR